MILYKQKFISNLNKKFIISLFMDIEKKYLDFCLLLNVLILNSIN